MADREMNSFELEASLTIAEVGAMHSRLTETLEADVDVEMNTTNVEQIDGAGLQLLAGFARDLKASNRTLTWTGVTDDLMNSVRLLGLAGVMGFEDAAN